MGEAFTTFTRRSDEGQVDNRAPPAVCGNISVRPVAVSRERHLSGCPSDVQDRSDADESMRISFDKGCQRDDFCLMPAEAEVV
jgi:hypothetical protein